MALTISDEFEVEDQLRAMGGDVWTNWEQFVRPPLLEDPSPTNGDLVIDETHSDQVWIPDTHVYVTFDSDNYHVYLLGAVDIGDDPI